MVTGFVSAKLLRNQQIHSNSRSTNTKQKHRRRWGRSRRQSIKSDSRYLFLHKNLSWPSWQLYGRAEISNTPLDLTLTPVVTSLSGHLSRTVFLRTCEQKEGLVPCPAQGRHVIYAILGYYSPSLHLRVQHSAGENKRQLPYPFGTIMATTSNCITYVLEPEFPRESTLDIQ